MKEITKNRIKIRGKRSYQKFILFTSIHSMLMLTIGVVCIASAGIWYLVQNYLIRVNKELYGIQKDSADIYVSGVEEKLSNYITAMGVVSMSNDLRDYIFTQDVSRSEMVMLSKELGQRISEMTFFLYQSQEVISQRLYTSLPGDGYYFWDISEVREKAWFQDLKQKSPQWWYRYSDVTHSYHLTLAGIINNYNSKSESWGEGYCCQTITVDAGTLFLPYKGSYNSIYLFDNKSGDMIYDYSYKEGKHDAAFAREWIDETYHRGEDHFELPEKVRLKDAQGNTESYQVLTRKINVIDATAVFMFNPKQMEKPDGVGAIYATVGLLVVMMLLLILSNRMYNRKLNMLIERMDNFDEKAEPLEPMGGKDELARIERHLMKMQKRIQTLIQEEYTTKLQMMTAREQALMSCIHPHFLYNTLNIISAMACMEGADSTVEMIAALSSMFRYSSDVSRRNVTLKEELSNISDYLYIQSIRHKNAFTYRVDVKEEFCGYQTPKLILQPLIENVLSMDSKIR
ncbi:MAG: hypothetical protein E7255_03540 [Lachnospiraceae bacterium]|nr:hypothetical protein [Lachnospiraceae bacterium]